MRTPSPQPRNPGHSFCLEAELKGLKLRGTIWGWPGALEEKALPGDRCQGKSRGHTQAADPVQPRMRSWAPGLTRSCHTSSSRKKDLLSAGIRKPPWNPLSGALTPALSITVLPLSSAPRRAPLPPSPSSFFSSSSQRGLHCRDPTMRVELTHTLGVYFAPN